jgi:hypothetical protein
MRVATFVFLTFLCSAAGGDSLQGQEPPWVQRAENLGIKSAHLILEYSLADTCELGPIKVIERSHDELFDTDAIDQIVKSIIGPFDTTNRELIVPGFTSESEVKTFSMTNRMINWSTDLGHNFVLCQFDSDGKVANAKYTDGYLPPSKIIEDRPVARRLSLLGTRTQEVRFRVED